MLVKSGFNQIITTDLHQAELQGYFDCPVDNLRASPFLFQYIVESVSWFTSTVFPTLHAELDVFEIFDKSLSVWYSWQHCFSSFGVYSRNAFFIQIPDYRNAVIVAKNPMAAKRATSYAERLRLGIAVIHGEVKEEEEDIDGRNSPPNEDDSFSDR